MPAEPIRPDQLDGEQRLRADLANYLRGLSGPELADLLHGLPDPVKVDLIAALAARSPAHARLPHTWPGHPDAEFRRRRSLREVVTDRGAARAARRVGPARRHPGQLGHHPLLGHPARPPLGRPAAPRRGTPPPRHRPGRTGGDRVRRPGLPARARAARQGWRDW
jgi:hypothetical protein